MIAASNASERSLALDLPDGLGSLVVRVDRPGGDSGSSMITWVVPDPRGVGIVQRKAAQLPTGTPTLVMVDVTSTLMDWSRSIESYLASGRHSWVSAVCLFTSGFARPEALVFGGHMMRGWNVMDRLGEIRVPTLVIAGHDDFLFRPESQALLAAGIPNARLQIIERTGHNPQSERPAETLAAVAGFLAAVPALTATPAPDAAVTPPAPARA